MGKVKKTTVRHGLLVKQESSYDEGHGTTSPSTSADEVEPEAPIDIPREYAFSGDRDVEAGAGAGSLARLPASGRFGQVDIPVLFRGPGSAYSAASDVEVNALMEACGHVPTVSTSSGSEEVAYSPSTDLNDLTSVAASFYGIGKEYPAQAGIGTLGFELTDSGLFLFTFSVSFRLPDRFTDVSWPSFSYDTQAHPTATNIGMTIGNFTAVVKSLSFSQNRGVSGRNDYGGGGHAGFAPGRMEPQLEVTIEAPALASSSPWHTGSDFDPDEFYESAQGVAIDFTIGGTQYNQLAFNAPQAELAEPPSDSSEENTATYDLTFNLPASSPAADDFYTITAK